MRCCNCGEKITDFKTCPRCKTDTSGYLILKRASATYYNMGLMKAQGRDLSGAVVSLRLALCVDKDNIDARNLLGLVYYEMGEVVSAFREWVISRSYKAEDNIANKYLKKIQSNQNRLDAMNQSIKKFNICIEYLKNDNFDIARIQLKKIAQVNPKFIKASLMLSLILMKKGEYEKAKKLLTKVLSNDRGNAIGRRYLAECEKKTLEKKKEEDRDYTKPVTLPLSDRKKKDDEDKKPLSGNDVIIPKVTYREPANGAVTVIDILIGVAVGAALMWFLIIPSKEAGLNASNKKQVTSYVEQLSTNQTEIARLDQALKDALDANETLKNGTSTNSKELENIQLLLAANEKDLSGDASGCMEILSSFGSDELVDANAKKLYERLMGANLINAYDRYMADAKTRYDAGDFLAAAEGFSKAYTINATDEAAYYASVSYRAVENAAEADKYYDILVKNYPQSDFLNR